MTQVEIRYRPTHNSVEKKNTKSQLVWAIMKIWDEVNGMDDGDRKNRIIKILLTVL